MAKIVLFNHVTLDGVMQAPGRALEDTRGGFQHGGWASAANDPVMFGAIGEGFGRSGSILLGRRFDRRMVFQGLLLPVIHCGRIIDFPIGKSTLRRYFPIGKSSNGRGEP